jgi:N-methylhydantoinase A
MANGVIRVANAAMVEALKLVSVRRGYDPRDFVLITAGGGGPMHGAALGAELRVRKVIVPPLSGVFSAWGMSLTEPRADVVRTSIGRTDRLRDSEVEDTFCALEHAALEQLRAEGHSRDLVVARSLDLRYRGQEHAVRVQTAAPAALDTIERAFHAEHRRAYGFELADEAIEVVTYHVAASAPRPSPGWPPVVARGGAAPKGRRTVDFDVDGMRDTSVYERDDLPRGFAVAGPIVVEEPTTTTLVHPGQVLEVDTLGNLVITP